MFKFLVIAALLGVTFALHPQGLRVRQVQRVQSHGGLVQHRAQSGLVQQRALTGLVQQRAHSAPVQQRLNNGHEDAQITRLSSQVNEDGSYGFEYELSNGAAAQESGIGGQHASGSFRHISPEGEQIQLTYTADENGFHPQGAHLPTPPPIPDAILRSIQYIQSHPSAEEQQNRQIRLQHNH